MRGQSSRSVRVRVFDLARDPFGLGLVGVTAGNHADNPPTGDAVMVSWEVAESDAPQIGEVWTVTLEGPG